MITWNPPPDNSLPLFVSAPLLRLYARTFRQYRLAGYTVPQALRMARTDTINGEP